MGTPATASESNTEGETDTRVRVWVCETVKDPARLPQTPARASKSCRELQEVAVSYSVLQSDAAFCRDFPRRLREHSRVAVSCDELQCIAVRCSAWQCVAVCCSVLQSDAECCSVLQRLPQTPERASKSCGELQCVAA